jgi:hypothetical protein
MVVQTGKIEIEPGLWVPLPRLICPVVAVAAIVVPTIVPVVVSAVVSAVVLVIVCPLIMFW